MKRIALLALVACVAAMSAAGARAADVAPSAAVPVTAPAPANTAPPASVEGADAAARSKGGEPLIKRTVIEDGQARIEELRVRGDLQKITVAPKGRAPGYEVLTGGGFHATAEDPGTSRGSAGKRVWNVLRF